MCHFTPHSTHVGGGQGASESSGRRCGQADQTPNEAGGASVLSNTRSSLHLKPHPPPLPKDTANAGAALRLKTEEASARRAKKIPLGASSTLQETQYPRHYPPLACIRLVQRDPITASPAHSNTLTTGNMARPRTHSREATNTARSDLSFDPSLDILDSQRGTPGTSRRHPG